MRYSTPCDWPAPNAGEPVTAYVTSWPSEKTSVAGPTSRPMACSGDMNIGVPTVMPVCVRAVASVARAIPKSMTRGPSAARRTLEGFRSRCTMSRACTSWSASATPAVSSRTVATGSGPYRDTAEARVGPSTNAVAIHGTAPSVSLSMTGAVYSPCTCSAAITSRRKRSRNSGSLASSGRIALRATGRPAWVWDR